MNSIVFRYLVVAAVLIFLNAPVSAQKNCVQTIVESSGVLESSTVQAPLPETIIIPVVVHVVYQSQSQNISNERIYSQIAALNRDFRKKNSNVAFVPTSFRELAADSRIEFRLATEDPAGLSTNGIIRVPTAASGFTADDKVKSLESGGDDAWNRDEYLNIWVANLSGGIMGYASTPGCDPKKDGVVIHYEAFGESPGMAGPFNKGRTAVHEIGHWLGLRHIWGDTECGDDRIEDTPPQRGPTRGCPSGVISTCTSGAEGNMYMNFMDFTNDECTSMFTYGQVNRMRGLFDKNGSRNAMLRSRKADGATAGFPSNEPAGLQTSVYPNPAQSLINIRLSLNASGSELIKVYNHSGQMVKSFRNTGAVMQLDVSELAPGMYLLKAGEEPGVKFIRVKG